MEIGMEVNETELLHQLLGELELDIMNDMWARDQATVREVLAALHADGRQLAYTTVMTVMGRLAEKGLLVRTLHGKTHTYRAGVSRADFLRRSAATSVQQLVDSFGDLALAQFAARLDTLSPERRSQLEQLANAPTRDE